MTENTGKKGTERELRHLQRLQCGCGGTDYAACPIAVQMVSKVPVIVYGYKYGNKSQQDIPRS